MTHTVEIIFGLLVAVAGLALLARKMRVAYPILFVIGGLVLGFIPGCPESDWIRNWSSCSSFLRCFTLRR
jgi:CPA1 family monovalent cation:H+ antiporter